MSEEFISEIAELFGRYKDEWNRKDFFQKKVLDLGGAHGDFDKLLDNYIHNNTDWNQEKEKPDPFLNGILMNFGGTRQFYGWQNNVLEQLGNPKNDVYVVAPPGGGKTTPLMAHYVVDIFLQGKRGNITSTDVQKLINNNGLTPQDVQKWADIFHGLLCGKYLNGQPVPRCLFVTPIRVLSFEQAEGFQDYFLDLLLLFHRITNKAQVDKFDKMKNSTDLRTKIVGLVFGSLGEALFQKFKNEDTFASYAKARTEDMICVKTGGGSGNFNSNPENAIVTIATYGSAKNFISKVGNTVRFVVFDEAHLYQPSEEIGSSNRSQENEVRGASDAYTVVDTLTKNKSSQIAFLSGTIHPVSAENFSQFLNRHYGRNMKVVSTPKGDTQAGNKTILNVNPDDGIRSTDEQVRRIINWINNGETGNAIIFFSKKKINELVDKVMAKLTQRDVRGDYSPNMSNRYREEKIAKYRRALAIANPNASAEDIKKEVDDFIKREFPTTQQELIDKIKNKPGATQIKNKKLRNAVGYGLGFIYRQDDIEPNDSNANVEPVDEKDKMIVADLFSHGKINVLLATAAIGVGVNVSIKNMYLPSCWKFERGRDNSGFVDLNNKREMSQLINRTGRGKVPISGIYTPKEFVPYLQDIVNMSIEDFAIVPAISISAGQDLKEVLIDLGSVVSSKSRQNYNAVKNMKTTQFISNKLHKIAEMCKKWSLERFDQKTDKQVEEMERQINLMDHANISGDKINALEKKLESCENYAKRVKEKLLAINEHQNPNDYAKCLLMMDTLKTKVIIYITKLENEIRSEFKILNSTADEKKDPGMTFRVNNMKLKFNKLLEKYNINDINSRSNTFKTLYDRKLQIIDHIKQCERKKTDLRQSGVTDPLHYNNLDGFITSYKKQLSEIDEQLRKQQTY